jgi:hypothetical protein
LQGDTLQKYTNHNNKMIFNMSVTITAGSINSHHNTKNYI